MSIRRRSNFGEFPRNLHILFWCDFASQKVHVDSTYIFRHNFDGWKIQVVSTYFFRRNVDGQKTGRRFWLSYKLIKTSWRFSFVSYFKKMTFVRLFYLNFSRKSPWCSLLWSEFESYNLQPCKRNCCQLVFLVCTEQPLYHIVFEQLHCYKVTLVIKCNKPLLQKF